MNTSAAGSQTTQSPLSAPVNSTATPRGDATRGASPADASPEQCHAFEAALRKKSSSRDDEKDDQGQDSDSDAGAALLAALAAGAPQAARHSAPAASPAPSATHTEPTGARAAIETALNHSAPLDTPLGAPDPASLWEASINEPNGIAVDVRALRGETTAQQSQPNWSVAISSSKVDAEVLNRHVTRLNERLRKHAVGFSHVRIEEQTGQDDAE